MSTPEVESNRFLGKSIAIRGLFSVLRRTMRIKPAKYNLGHVQCAENTSEIALRVFYTVHLVIM